MTDIVVSTQNVPVASPTLLWQDPSGVNKSYDIFVVTEMHELHSKVSDHPVEVGTDVADDMRPEVDHITLEVFVSQSPPGAGQRQNITTQLPTMPVAFTINGALTALGILGGDSQISPSLDVIQPKDYVDDALTTFRYLRDTATLITVILAHAQYSSMVLQNVTLHRDRATGLGGAFTLEFRQIRVVSTSLTDAPVATPTAAPEKKAGAVSVTLPKKSVAAAFTDAL